VGTFDGSVDGAVLGADVGAVAVCLTFGCETIFF
jgi:hypothetical protein